MPRERYLLPLEAIVEAMRESPDMVSVQAQLPALPMLPKEPCIAELIIGRGVLRSCAIATRAGNLLYQQKQAYTLLQQLGDLEWDVRPVVLPQDTSPVLEKPSPRQLSPSLPGTGMSILPVRAAGSLTPAQLRTLPSPYKHVFALADGTKTVEHIARLLAKSPQEILLILRDLQAMNLIKW